MKITGKRSLADFAGIFSDKQAKELESNVLENRKASRNRHSRLGV